MKIVNGIERYPPGGGPAVAAIGNFDGIHLGHQEILRRVIADARVRAVPSLLVSFDPHPLAVLAPERRPPLLQTRRQRLAQLEAAGLARLLLLAFDAEMAALDGRAFFERILGSGLRLAAVHVGLGFRFGRQRAGDLALLRRLGEEAGFDVHALGPVRLGDEAISSSAIRAAVAAGDLPRAGAMLGRPYAVTGIVVRGAGRGAALGCPTANVDVENELLPPQGVWITETTVGASRYRSVTNIGVRPTFGASSRVEVETHLLEFEDALYDARVDVGFLAPLREERRFADQDELAAQLRADRAAAAEYFQRCS